MRTASQPAAQRRRPRAFQRIVAAIRDDVFSRRLRPGDRLPHEPALGQRFNVSRLAVREALRVLELQGIVRVEHGFKGGAFVAEADAQPVSHALETMLRLERLDRAAIYTARRYLEPGVAALAAASASDETVVALRASVSESERLLASGRRPFSANLSFHAILAEACGNPILRLVTVAVLELLRAAERRAPSDLAVNREAARAHRSILAAVEARNADRAEREMAEHVAALDRYFARASRRRSEAPQ